MNARFWKWLVITALTIAGLQLAWPRMSPAAERGYIPRACGFDLDHDGIVGEASDCDICDGNQSTGAYTADPDGDAVNEDFYWVDCNSGTNTGTGPNAPNTAYRTLQYAISQLNGTGSSKEDIICVRATCSVANGSSAAGATLSQSGVTGSTSIAARTADNEQYAFSYPTNPAMIIGWDTDGDGCYPPYDDGRDTANCGSAQAEPAVFDAQNGSNYDIGFLNFGATTDYVEVGHFTMQNFGRGRAETTLYGIRFSSSAGTNEYFRLHDIEGYNMLRECTTGQDTTSRRVFYIDKSVGAGSWQRHIALENIYLAQSHGWPVRGWGNNQNESTDWRFNHFEWHDPDPATGSASLSFKVWRVTDFEFINSKFEKGPSMTTAQNMPCMDGEPQAHNYYYVNNEFIGCGSVFNLKTRSVTSAGRGGPWYIVRNYATWPDGMTDPGPNPAYFFNGGEDNVDGLERTECNTSGCVVGVQGPCEADADPRSNNINVGDNVDCDCDRATSPDGRVSVPKEIIIENNVVDFNQLADVGGFVTYQFGSNCAPTVGDPWDDEVGPLRIRNNTVKNLNIPSNNNRAAIIIGWSPTRSSVWDYRYVYGKVYIHNNIFSGLTSDFALINWKRGGYYSNTPIYPLDNQQNYDPGVDFFADRNIYIAASGSPRFRLGPTEYSTLAAWKSITSEDDNSLSCDPQFDADGFHLTQAASTSCARNNGDNTNCAAVDFDGEARPQATTCDIGADEVLSGAVGTVQFGAQAYPVAETAGTVAATITRAGGTSGAIAVDWATTATGAAVGGASCTSGVDYITESGTANFSNASATPVAIDVAICDDNEVEPNEGFSLALTNPTGGSAIAAPSTATVTISSEDVAPDFPVIGVGSGVIASVCPVGAVSTLTVRNVPGAGVPAGQNRMLLCGVASKSAYNPAAPTDPDCDMAHPDNDTSVVWNSHSMTRLTSRVDNNGPTGDESVCVSIYGLLAPEAVTSDAVVTFHGAVTTPTVACVAFEDAEQILPGATQNQTDDGPLTATSESTSLGTLVDSVTLIDVFAVRNRVGAGNATPGGGQSELADMSCSTAGSHMMMSRKGVSTPTLAPMGWSWTAGTPEAFAHAIVAIHPVVAAPTTTTVPVTTTTLPDCGDGVIDVGEECDPNGAGADNLNGKKCSNFSPLAEGTLACNADCTFDFTGCTRTTRGRVGVLRALGWCEASSEPACAGTCPPGYSCVDIGATCECQ